MIEFMHDGPSSQAILKFVKNFFELVRNILVVSTIKYISIKTGDFYIAALLQVCYILIGAQVSFYLLGVSFKRSLFASNRSAQVFGMIISVIFTIPFAVMISFFITHIAEVAANAQLVR